MPTDEQVAETSPAPVEAPSFSLSDLTFEQRKEWRKTAVIPEAKEADPPAATPAADKSAQPPQQGKKKNAAERTAEIEADVQKLEAALHRKAELKRQLAEEPGDKSGAPPASAKPAELKAPTKPKVDDFKTWEEFQGAQEKYFEDLTDYKSDLAVQKALAAVEEKGSKQKEDTAQASRKERWDKAIGEVKTEVGAEKWDEGIEQIKPILNEPGFQMGATFILESENPRLLLALAQDEALLKEIAAMSPVKQVAALGKLEGSLEEKPVKAVKKETQTPPPARNIGARSLTAGDPMSQAVADGNYREYKRLANEADRKKRRG